MDAGQPTCECERRGGDSDADREGECVCVRDGERIIPEAIVFPRNNRVLFISLGE